MLASALLFGLYAQGGSAWPLGFFALLPWLLTLDTAPGLAASLRSGWLMSVAFVAAVFGWFGVAIGEFTGAGSLVGMLVLLLAAPLLQPQFLTLALVRHWAGQRHGALLRTLAAASAWVAAESLLPRLLGDSIGHGLYASRHYRQVADLTGVAGLAFVLVVMNECLALLVQRWRQGLRAWIAPSFVLLSLLALGWAYGSLRLMGGDFGDSDSPRLRIGMVQSNIYDYENLRRQIGAYGVVREVLDTHYALSREALKDKRVDALLWSETVYPTTFGHPKSEDGAALDREILDFVTASGAPLVFGTYDRDEKGGYNAAAFVQPMTGLLGFYRKANTFPLTEHVPGWLDSGAFRRLFPWTGSWQPGDGARVFPLRLADGREIPVLPLICLDDVDTGLGIEGARLGPQAILTMSNDSWFTRYPAGARLHLQVAAFRSIEARLPQFRVTANGYSALINAEGDIVASTGMGERRVLVAEATVGDAGQTYIVRWGDWVGRASALFLLLLAAYSPLARRDHASRAAARARMLDGSALAAPPSTMPAIWRLLHGLLRIGACIGLVWFGGFLLFGHGMEASPLRQLKLFTAVVLVPQLAAWCLRRAFAQPTSAASEAATAKEWDLPLPRWLKQFVSIYTRARALAPRSRLDHWAVKFLLFPWVPALPAFRLHQHIAYGGTFGEYYSFGLKAYLLALLIWWTSWAVGLVLYAALLRAGVEAASVAALALGPGPAFETRCWAERLARVLFYVGVPVWLALRVVGAGV